MTTMAEAAIKLDEARNKAADSFDWADPLDLESCLTEEERLVRDTARGYAQGRLMPRVLKAYREENFDRAIMTGMGGVGLLGAPIPEAYGGAGPRKVAHGVVRRAGGGGGFGYRPAVS